MPLPLWKFLSPPLSRNFSIPLLGGGGGGVGRGGGEIFPGTTLLVLVFVKKTFNRLNKMC